MKYLLLSFIVATYWLSAAQNTYFSKACKRIFSPEYMYVYILIWDYLANAGDDTGMSDCALLLWWDIPLVALMQGLLPRLSDFPRHSILSMCKPHLPRLQPQVGEQQEPSWGFSSNNCGAGKKKRIIGRTERAGGHSFKCSFAKIFHQRDFEYVHWRHQ